MDTSRTSNRSIAKCLTLGLLLRLGLLVYAEWVDRTDSVVQFTDIDYHVFTDAARFIERGQSPYLRATYRYTPLLAFLLVPNVTFNRNWGKLLFVACDLVAGWLIYRILLHRGLSPHRAAWSFASIWILNPFVAVISTRGSSEAVLGALVLTTLYLLLLARPVLAGLVFGLSVHFKIYPIVYALPFLLLLNQDYPGYTPLMTRRIPKPLPDPALPPPSTLLLSSASGKRKLDASIGRGNGHVKHRRIKSGPLAALLHELLDFANPNRIMFTLASAGIFLLLNAIMFAMYVFQLTD